MQHSSYLTALITILLIAGCGQSLAQTTEETLAAQLTQLDREHYSPHLEKKYSQNLYWGETHLHTTYSTDSGLFGTRLTPDAAYRFAKGEEVVSNLGVRTKIIRPLDFLMVADHAENLGLAPMIEESNPQLLASEWGKKIHDLSKAGKAAEAFGMWGETQASGIDALPDPELVGSMWGRMMDFSRQHNDPGTFTAILGYEWTSMPDTNNLHRVVVFRDDEDKVGKLLPFSAFDSHDPEDLWAWMATYEKDSGGQVFAIPHNGNLSNGLMFAVETLDGKPIDKDYAERRARWEPLYEVTQIKGDSEAHPQLAANDEFADYGTWDKGNFAFAAKTDAMLPHEYARSALKLGLQLKEKLGANPYKFGLVGATDSHTGIASTREDNSFGKIGIMEPGNFPDRWDERVTGALPVSDGSGKDISIAHRQSLASGLQGVWAQENTRTALFDAMRNKETYATTGTRMAVRVFAGWDYAEGDVDTIDFAEIGYKHGVPMGGDLSNAPTGKSPRLMVQALKDPDGAHLDRVQIIKGWLDGKGETHEIIYDVACSDNRAVEARRCNSLVGNTVNVANAIYTNTIGESFLSAYWEDPDFNAKQSAFYYVRVLEIPTPRWTTYDAVFYKLDLPKDVPATQQERAYTSPTWYTPGG
jgi:hypothetical protein